MSNTVIWCVQKIKHVRKGVFQIMVNEIWMWKLAADRWEWYTVGLLSSWKNIQNCFRVLDEKGLNRWSSDCRRSILELLLQPYVIWHYYWTPVFKKGGKRSFQLTLLPNCWNLSCFGRYKWWVLLWLQWWEQMPQWQSVFRTESLKTRNN